MLRRSKWKAVAAVACLTAMLALTGSWALQNDRAAAGEAPPGPAIDKAPLGAAHVVDLAAELAAIGRERKDALLVLSAARLLAESGARIQPGLPVVSGGNAAEAAPAWQSQPRSPEALLAEAKTYAIGNATIRAVLDQFSFAEPDAGSKGTAGGHNAAANWIRPGATATFYADFRAREPAEVALWGDGSGDLDLVIYDAAHRPVCVSSRPGDREWCRWIPRQNERFALVVESRSRIWNRYSIFTN
jgi:hypothetical protein